MRYKYFMVDNTHITEYSPLHKVDDDDDIPIYWNRHECLWSRYQSRHECLWSEYQSRFRTPERLIEYLKQYASVDVTLRWVTEEEANRHIVESELVR